MGYAVPMPFNHAASVRTAVARTLLSHLYDSYAEAHADNVAFVCVQCDSIASVTPGFGRTREQERDLIGWVCCDESTSFRI